MRQGWFAGLVKLGVVGAVVGLLAAGCGGGGGGGKKKKRKAANVPPIFTLISPVQTIDAFATLNIATSATDADNDPLAMTATGVPTNATFMDNGNGTGDFSFTPDALQIGMVFSVIFGADDANNPIVTQTVDITVTTPPNFPPTITIPSSPQLVLPGDTLAFTVTGMDPEFDPLTLTALPLPPGASWVDNGNDTGDFSFPTNLSLSGMLFIVVFTADDGVNLPVSQNLTIEVINQPPVLQAIGARDAPELSPIDFTIVATDPEGDPITLTAAPLPGGAGFLDNGNGTGNFTFTAAAATTGNVYTVTFSADDGNNPPTAEVVDITVIAPNAPPVVAAIPSTPVTHGSTANVSVSDKNLRD